MQFGLHIGQQNISMDEMRRLWRWADTAGFDWVDVWDHFYEAPYEDGNGSCFEATTCMAAIACETTNVRIGVLVLGMNYRHPAVLANALTTIDHLSGGRLEIGLGAGWHAQEYAAYGIPFPPIGQRMDILEEGVQVVRLLTTQDRANFSGKYFSLSERRLQPEARPAAAPDLDRRQRREANPPHRGPPRRRLEHALHLAGGVHPPLGRPRRVVRKRRPRSGDHRAQREPQLPHVGVRF